MNTNPTLPLHLSLFQAQGLIQNEPIAQFEIGSTQNFVYLILDWVSKKAAIVDPQKDLTLPLQALSENTFQLESIILTHTHFDHTAGVVPLLKIYPNLKIWVGERDLHRLPSSVTSSPNLKIISSEGEFSVGQLKVKTLLTPGHSAGAVSYFIDLNPPYVFTGDTIFIKDCGRTDLETGSNEEMFSSIQKISKLPPNTILLVGHHYAKAIATTFQDEISSSPPFQCKSVEELASLP